MSTHEERLALASFLRTRRERVTPAEVGFPVGQRRRTPGLRREELAQLAGISVTWYTWLEQGRDITVSSQVLESLASALRLNSHEKNYLFVLANIRSASATTSVDEPLNPVLQLILDQQGANPAYIMGRYWDILAWNQAAALLFDFGENANMLWYLFDRPAARQLIVDWEDRAQRLLAEFRADCSQYVTEPSFTRFVDALKAASPEFSAWWPLHHITSREGGRREFEHPLLGRLVLYQTTFYLSSTPQVKLVLHTPVGEDDTVQKLERLIKDQKR
jgi:transcriptional regulator with XRE-family HTH domain